MIRPVWRPFGALVPRGIAGAVRNGVNEGVLSTPCEDQKVVGKDCCTDSGLIMFPSFGVTPEQAEYAFEE